MTNPLFQAAMATRDADFGPMDAWDIEQAMHFFEAGISAAQASSAPKAPSLRLQIAAQLTSGFMAGYGNHVFNNQKLSYDLQEQVIERLLSMADALIAQGSKQ